MSLAWRGERRTPKEMAAILVSNLLELLPGDWIPDRDVTNGERAAVIEHIGKYKARIDDLLGVNAEVAQ